MSWDSYVTSMEGEGCQYSGFFGQDGNKWAESPNACLKINKDHIENMVKGLKSSTINTGQSVLFGDRKFLVVNTSGETAVMKQLGGEDKMMACVSLTRTGVCVGAACGEKEKCSRASAEKFAEYLKTNNL
ncbi:uncharacterized protein LOC143276724 isoform X2 [Babylonia areolata]|uniref:uncharacterized protein LOC143276724 isoform X2 n=1 Tax=Babylonia areolata TaxID=304850 RepID=UPI003FD63725